MKASTVVAKPLAITRRNAVRRFALFAAGVTLTSGLRSFAAEVPLAIKGYDPVAYFTNAKPTPGLPAIEYEWDEHRYRFATAEHRDLFKADPAHYAPQFGNYCAMALAKGEIVMADPENWAINDGKLYVFGKPAPAGPVLFQQNVVENVAKANGNRSILPKQ
jgi:hypothetical protein